MLGEWPSEDVDHINGDKADNRWANLRAATTSQNIANSRCHRLNACGFKGVYRKYGKWCANVRIKGKLIYLGLFVTREEAAMAYATAAYGLFGDFSRPHWRSLWQDIRGAGWRKPQIEELSLDREEIDRLLCAGASCI
jgi:hypothetical protein